MSHAVLVTSYSFPGHAAHANRLRALANGVAERQGWSVTVVGSVTEQQYMESSNYEEELFNIVSCPATRFTSENLIFRAWGELRQTFRLLRAAKAQQPNVLIISIPSLFLLLAIFSRQKGVPVVVDIRDLVWDYLAESNGFRSWVGRIFRFAARYLLRRSAGITVTNDRQARAVQETLKKTPQVIHNGISKQRFERLTSIPVSKTAKNPFHVVYIGNIGLAQELDTLVDAIGGDPNYQVTLVGGGTDYSRIEKILTDKCIINVTLTGPLAWEQTLAYCEEADCLYGQIGKVFTTAVPSKIFEYACCGRPVIFAAPKGAARDIISQFSGFYSLSPGDSSQLQKMLEEIRTGATEIQVNVDYNRNLVRNSFLREESARKFAEVVQSVFDKKFS